MSELSNGLLLAYIGVMALVTYLIRLLPLVLFTQKINNVFVRSFLYYVPYAVLGAMTVPAIFTSTNSVISAVLGGLTAVFFAYREKSLLFVAVAASLVAFLVERVLDIIFNEVKFYGRRFKQRNVGFV